MSVVLEPRLSQRWLAAGLILAFAICQNSFSASATKTIELAAVGHWKQTNSVSTDSDDPNTVIIGPDSSATYVFIIPPDDIADLISVSMSYEGTNGGWGSVPSLWIQDIYGGWSPIGYGSPTGGDYWQGPWLIPNSDYRLDSSAIGAEGGLFSVIMVKYCTGWGITSELKRIRIEMEYEPQVPFVDEWCQCIVAGEACRCLAQPIAMCDIWSTDHKTAFEEVFLEYARYLGDLNYHLACMISFEDFEIDLWLEVAETLYDLSQIDFLLDFDAMYRFGSGARYLYYGPAPITNVDVKMYHGLANCFGDPDGIGPLEANAENLTEALSALARAWRDWEDSADTQYILNKYADVRSIFEQTTISYNDYPLTWPSRTKSLVEHASSWESAWRTLAWAFDEEHRDRPTLSRDFEAAENLGKEMQLALEQMSYLIDRTNMPDPAVTCKDAAVDTEIGAVSWPKFVVTNYGGNSSWVGLTVSIQDANIVGYRWPNTLPAQGYEHHSIVSVSSYQKDDFYAGANRIGQATNYPQDYNSSDPHWATDPVNAAPGYDVDPLPHQMLEVWRELEHGESMEIPIAVRGTGRLVRLWYRVAALKETASGFPSYYLYCPTWGEADQQGWAAYVLTGTNDPPRKPTISPASPSGRSITITVSATDPDSDNVRLKVEWGDGSDNGWTNLFSSGSIRQFTHTYSAQGNYEIVGYSQDAFGQQSEPSDALSVTIDNTPPYEPNAPWPQDGGTASITSNLGWQGGDPDPGDIVTYDVYFGTNPTPDSGEFMTNTPETVYDLPVLDQGIVYYWKVVARDNHGSETQSPIWNFATAVLPGFSLVATPEGQTLAPGETAELEVEIVASGGFSADVQLTVESIYPDTSELTCSFETNPCPAGSSTTMVVTAGSGLAYDTYDITIFGQGGGTVDFLNICVSAAPIVADLFVDDDAPNDPGTGTAGDPFRYIQDAIDAAIDGDVIVVRAGTYTGAKNRNIDFRGKAITLRSENGPETCVIDCQHAGRGFYFHTEEDSNSVLDGFIISDGNSADGAGLYCYESGPTVRNCIITGNHASSTGGGILCTHYSSPTISNNIIIANSGVYGGGMYNQTDCNTIIEDCTFVGNTAKYTGGGIRNWSCSPTIIRCEFTSNSAMEGGGMNNYGGAPRIIDCKFISNKAVQIEGYNASGGGMYNERGHGSIIRCVFQSNMAGSSDSDDSYGGGMSNEDGAVSVLNCTFRENMAICGWGSSACGGGVYNAKKADVTLEKCILEENIGGIELGSGSGGGVYNADSVLKVTNCTLVDNYTGGLYGTGQGGGICSKNGVVSVVNCILWNNAGDELHGSSFEVRYSNIQHNGGIGTGNLDVNPKFADYHDYHLKSKAGRWDSGSRTWVLDAETSVCVDAGDPNSNWTAEHWPHGRRVNMGAYGGTIEASLSETRIGKPDLNMDYAIDFEDYAIMSQSWLIEQTLLPEDLDCDGKVDFNDLTILAEHWAKAPEWYTLTASVLGDGGTISPMVGTYSEGMVVILVADPDEDYVIKAWTGTSDDRSLDTVNSVVMYFDRIVTLEFEQYDYNWGFERGDFSHWGTSTYGSGSIGVYASGMTEGTYCAALSAVGYQNPDDPGDYEEGNAHLFRTIELTEDRLYSISFDYRTMVEVLGFGGAIAEVDIGGVYFELPNTGGEIRHFSTTVSGRRSLEIEFWAQTIVVPESEHLFICLEIDNVIIE